MKKLILVALLAIGLNGFAQEAGKKGGADKMMQKMTTELSLTADQQAAIKPIVEEQVALKKDSKENPDHADANKEKGKELSKKIKNNSFSNSISSSMHAIKDDLRSILLSPRLRWFI